MANAPKAGIIVNGKPREIGGDTPLLALLDALGVNPRVVAVGINGEVIAKDTYGEAIVRAGDDVEIVRMVGGGAL